MGAFLPSFLFLRVNVKKEDTEREEEREGEGRKKTGWSRRKKEEGKGFFPSGIWKLDVIDGPNPKSHRQTERQ